MASDRRRRDRLLFLAAVTGVLALAVASPLSDGLRALGVDLALPAARAVAPRRPPSSVMLIVIDEVTHAAPPFEQAPEVAWTPYLARVLQAVGAAGPRVAGLDVIYPKTLALPDLAPGFDRPFLATLAELGRSGRLVLSQVRLSDRTIAPYPGQQVAVGGPANIRSVHLAPDADDVLRRQPAAAARDDGRSEASFAVELARRAGAPVPSEDYWIDFRGDPDRFVAYRLADLYACARAGRADAFAPFAGKVVLVGAALDVEDRRLAADRFSARKTPEIRAGPCGGGPAVQEPRRQSTPGLMIVARAVDTLLTGSALHPASRPLLLALAWALLLPFGAATLWTPPPVGAAAATAGAAGAWGAGVAALAAGWVAPWPAWIVALGFLVSAAYAYRALIEGAARRRITHAFGHYLSPAVVQRLADHPEQVKLGGERRWVAVMFADMEGFSRFAAERPPEAAVARLNAVFAAVARAVEAEGGYVDKFMGDGVLAVWGAPEADPAPEGAAARAALACIRAAEALEAAPRLRIGLSSGEVIAGNLGAPRRFDYTVIGDAVNWAARLETCNKLYGTGILMADAFAARLGSGFVTRAVERTTLRGASREIVVHELIGYASDPE